MKYRNLGKTNLRVSVIGLGTWQFGGEWAKDFSQSEVTSLLSTAKNLGINLLDTAECYGDHTSERLIGGAIPPADRSSWIIATKFGHKFHSFLNRSEPRTPADIRVQLEDSLRALQTDYVDLYQYHSFGDDQFFDDAIQSQLEKFLAQGKVRHLGNSVSKNDNTKQVAASTQKKIESIQIIYNRLDRTPESTTFPICQEQNLGVLARVPLASGLLSGKYSPSSTFPPDDVRSKRDPAQLQKQLQQVQQIQREELPAGVTMPQYALAWCLRHPAVTSVIPGCKDLSQLHSNASAADLVKE